MHLFSLCSSSRAGSSYLIRGRGGCLLVDCGSTNRHLKMALSQAGASIGDVVSCVLTHSHPDHTQSVPFLERSKIPLIARVETKKVLEAGGRSKGGIVEPQHSACRTGEFCVRFLELPHYSRDGGSCVLVETEGESVAILTDAGRVPREILERVRGATLVICESNHDAARARSGIPFEGGNYRPLWVLVNHSLGPSGHLSNDEAAGVLEGVVTPSTKHVVLCHISEDYNRPEVAKSVVSKRLSEKGWGGAIHIAPPDMVYGPISITASD